MKRRGKKCGSEFCASGNELCKAGSSSSSSDNDDDGNVRRQGPTANGIVLVGVPVPATAAFVRENRSNVGKLLAPGAEARFDPLASGRFRSGDGNRFANTGLRANSDRRDTAETATGGNGNRAGAVPALLLLKVLRPAQHGSDGDELRLFGVQNRRSSPPNPGRHQRVPSHQTGPRTETSDSDGLGSALHQPEVTGD